MRSARRSCAAYGSARVHIASLGTTRLGTHGFVLLEVFEGVREGSNIDIESTVATNRRSFNFEAGLEGKAPRWHQVDAAALQLEATQGDDGA